MALQTPDVGPMRSTRERRDMTVAQRENEVEVRLIAHGAYKGHLTRAIKAAVKLADTAISSDGISPTVLTQLIIAFNRLDKQRDHATRSAKLMGYYDEQDVDTIAHYEDLTAAEVDRSEDAFQALTAQIARFEAALQPPLQPPQGPRQASQKVAQDLRPKALTREAQPVELKVWISRFTAYFAASKMSTLDLLIQHEYFRACLDDYLVERLENSILPDTEVIHPRAVGDQTCLTLLQAEFTVFYPMYTRRLQFFRASCAPGQSYSQWASALRRLGDEAQIESMKAEDLYVMRYLTGYSDPILSELLKIEDPSQAKFDQCITQFEQSTAFRATNPAAAPAMAAYGQSGAKPKQKAKGKVSQAPKPSQQAPKRQQPAAGNKKGTSSSAIGQKMDSMRNSGQCTRCGSRQQGHACNYAALQCQKCGRPGHISSVCLGHLRQAAPTANAAQSADLSQFPQLPPPIRMPMPQNSVYDDGSYYEPLSEAPRSFSLHPSRQQ